MAAKRCIDCGSELTQWNRNFFGKKCFACNRVPYSRAKAYFELAPLNEQDIHNWRFSKSNMTLIGYALFLFACMAVGSLVGLGNGGTYQGLGYSFIATLLGIIFFRWLVSRTSVHPMTNHRWFNFAFPYSFILFFSWVFAYLGWMPVLVGRHIAAGSIFSHHVSITSAITIPAFDLVLLMGAAAAILAAIVSFWNASRQEAKNKTQFLALYQRWQQSAA